MLECVDQEVLPVWTNAYAAFPSPVCCRCSERLDAAPGAGASWSDRALWSWRSFKAGLDATHHISVGVGFGFRLVWSWLPTLHRRLHGNPLKDCQHHFYSLAHCKGGILFPSHSCFDHLSASIIRHCLCNLDFWEAPSTCVYVSACVCVFTWQM